MPEAQSIGSTTSLLNRSRPRYMTAANSVTNAIGSRLTDAKPLVGLLGVLVAVLGADFNECVSLLTLTDVRGALGVSYDPGLWIASLYITGMSVGMAFAPWNAVTFTLRRFTLFAIGLACVVTGLIPFAANLPELLTLRLIQGLSSGLTIPLLMTTALRVLAPRFRIYGLAVYAPTVTFSPNISISLAALWVDVMGDWRFVFLQAVPLDAIAAVLVWYGLPQDTARYERLRQFDWRGALLILVGGGSLTTLMLHGDHYDWFNSPTICLLALASAVAFPLLIINEWFHPLPLLKLQMLGRRNLANGVIALALFLTISLTSSAIPQEFLADIQDYRPLQAQGIDLLLSLAQLGLLPAVAFLLDHQRVDARAVILCGLALLLAACLGCARVDSSWNRDQFYFWQDLQMVGQPMVAVSLLLFAINTVKGPEEGPFVSALVNSVRGLADPAGTWLVELVARWRGGLHSDRLVDQVGQNWFRIYPVATPCAAHSGVTAAKRSHWRREQPAAVRSHNYAAGERHDLRRHLLGHGRALRCPHAHDLGAAHPDLSPTHSVRKEVTPMSANVIESRSALVPSGSAPQPSEATAVVPRTSRWRKFAVKAPWLMAAAVIVAFVGVAALRIYAPTANVWTDDAYLEAHYATIAPRVAGQVVAVKVDDEDRVKAGQLLVELDDRDYQVALAQAAPQVAAAQASIENIDAQIAVQQAQIAQNESQVEQTQASLTYAEQQLTRYATLARDGWGTVQNAQQWSSQRRQGEASAKAAQDALVATARQLAVLKAQRSTADAKLEQAMAQRNQAKLNLSYTNIRAPMDGMIAERGVQVGKYVSPGTGLMAVVPLSQVYVVANYREVQLQHVKAGQPATIRVDAYNIDLAGTVVDVPAATGTTFTPLQPENVTGNFTKIVQRLPVRIDLMPGQPLARLLRVGLSVETTIHTGFANTVATARDAGKNGVSNVPPA